MRKLFVRSDVTEAEIRAFRRGSSKNYKLAAEAIGVFVLILRETNVPLHKIIEALTWAWNNMEHRP